MYPNNPAIQAYINQQRAQMQNMSPQQIQQQQLAMQVRRTNK